MLERTIRHALAFHALAIRPSTECPVFPEHIHIEPTNACNLRCVHCHQSAPGNLFNAPRGRMPLDLFRRIIDDIAGHCARVTLDSQGEPLLHPQIVDMIAYAKQQGLAVSLITNATRLTPALTEQILELQTDRVVFSFEGSRREIYESVRRRSHYEQTLRHILHFLIRNHELCGRTFVCMSMVEQHATRDDVDAYRAFFMSLPVDTVFVNPLLTMSGASPAGSREVALPSPHSSAHSAVVCRLPWETLSVNWNGTVSACPVDYNECHIIGDAGAESLLSIWNSDAMQRFRRCHLEHDFAAIEAQGSLCATCNCRFQPEYDLANATTLVTNHLLRQFEVHARATLRRTEADQGGGAARVADLRDPRYLHAKALLAKAQVETSSAAAPHPESYKN